MPKRGYHHGNLRQALVDAALALIEEKGPTGFTLSEAAKQAGVTPAAVYRHFAGRDDLIAEHLDMPVERVAAVIAERGLVAGIEEMRQKPGRTLRPYVTPDLNDVQTWLADHEVLDPEGPEEMFESISERGLFRRMKGWFGRS